MRRYIYPVVLMFLSVGMYLLYIAPTWESITKLQSQKSELDTFIEKAGEAQEKITKIQAQHENFSEEQKNALKTILPEKIDPIHLILELNNLVSKQGLYPHSPQVSLPVPTVVAKGKAASVSAPYAKYTVSFSVSAPYKVFRNLLRDLESSLALRDVQSIAFSTVRSAGTDAMGDPNLASYDYTITIATYALH